MTTTYTVYRSFDGSAIARGLTLVDAAKERLGYGDAGQWELRRDAKTGVWELFCASRFGGMQPAWDGVAGNSKPIMSAADTEEAAFAEMARQIAFAAWPRQGVEVMTDADYDEMMTGAEG